MIKHLKQNLNSGTSDSRSSVPFTQLSLQTIAALTKISTHFYYARASSGWDAQEVSILFKVGEQVSTQ